MSESAGKSNLSQLETKAEAEEAEKAKEAVPRNQATPDTYIVKVFKKNGTSYYRAAPYTMVNPTEHQIRARQEFGKLASRAKGKKWKGQYGIPLSALMVKGMKNYTFGQTRKLKKWERILYGIE